ncbi:MAG: ABC transporter substrate-binding protein [Actinomycetia bacterium]|nr:ABC transporter substrate-binding protein [Actinomycetes bacterium]MCP4961549.1 ABC transporter substrate-binding protein [Actinomycetes bacterium]
MPVVLLVGCSEPDKSSEPVVIENPRPASPARTVGFDTSVFRVGVLVDLTGPGAEQAASLLAGVEAYWSTVNAVGGVDHSFPVELVVRDTGGSTAAAVAAFGELEPDVALFTLVGDTGAIDAIRSLAESAATLVVPATRQSTWGTIPNLLPLGASYAVEGFSAVAWMTRVDTEPTLLCTVRDASPGGDDLLVGALLAMRDKDNLQEASIDASPGISAAVVVEQIEASGCERVVVAASAPVSGPILAAMAERDLPVEVAVGSEVDFPLPDAVEAWAVGRMIVSVDAPSWGDERPGPSALRIAMDGYLPDARPDPWIRAGFAAQYATDVLLTAATRKGSVTREDLLDLATNLEPDTDGLVGAPDRSLGRDGYVRSVTIHEVVQVGGDPLGLRPIQTYEAPGIEAVEEAFR